MTELGTDDPAAVRNAGAIDLAERSSATSISGSLLARLFGSEVSSNAASSFATGLKGRPAIAV
jgi:benzoyl-CoA 2,3-dioxygenase component B